MAVLKQNIIKEKSFAFAIRIIKMYNFLKENKKEFILSKQLMRSGTSIGAMVREAINAETAKDFIHKLSVAQKECDETCYWLELLKEANYISEKEFISIYNDAIELLKIIRSIIIKSKQKLKTNNS
jgi:four helix bundle protein